MASTKRYEIAMGFGGGYSIPVASKIPVIGKLASWEVTEYVIEDMISHEKAFYLFSAAGGSKGKFPVTVNVSSTPTSFQSELDIQDFGGSVKMYGVAAGKNLSRMTWLDGKAQGLSLDTSGWQLSTPSVGVCVGMLKLRDVYVPPTLAWDRARYTVNIWRLDFAEGSIVKYWSFQHWGTIYLNASNESRFMGLGSSRVFDWEWQPGNRMKAPSLPVYFQSVRRGKFDPFSDPNSDGKNLQLYEGSMAGQIVHTLKFGNGLITGDTDYFVVPNNVDGVRSMFGKPQTSGGYGFVAGEKTNGLLSEPGKAHKIIWILTNRIKETKS
jgi:hypothetical protein